MSRQDEIVTPKEQNKEVYDTFGSFSFFSWHDNADDYKLIAEALEIWRPTSWALYQLNYINKFVHSEKYIFDGTISNLKYLIKNNYLKIEDIPDKTTGVIDLEILKGLLVKYSQPNIDDIFDSVQGGQGLKRIYLDHPKTFFEGLRYIPEQARQFVEKLPESKQELNKMLGLDKNGKEEVSVNRDRWSPQAIRCKLIKILLYVESGKVHLARGTKLAEHLSSLTEKDIDETNEKKLLSLNSLWSAFNNHPWLKKRGMTFQELHMQDGILITTEGSDLYEIYEHILYPSVKKIADKYFEGFNEENPFTFPVKQAVIIILYRTTDEIDGKERHSTMRFDGFINKFWEYVFDEKGNLKDWFVEYFEKELEQRIKFIKSCDNMGIFKLPWNKNKMLYFPVFESFRFMSKIDIQLIHELKEFFKSDKIDDGFKNEVIKPIVFNIQKTFLIQDRDEWEETIKDRMLLFLMTLFEPLRKRVINKVITYRNLNLDNDQLEDLQQISNVELMDTILRYDASKNPNFFGYMKTMLPLNIRTVTLPKKIAQKTSPLDEIDENWEENIPSDDDFVEKMNSQIEINRIKELLSKVSPEQRKAIEKAIIRNEKLTDTERRNKNRGIDKLRSLLGTK